MPSSNSKKASAILATTSAIAPTIAPIASKTALNTGFNTVTHTAYAIFAIILNTATTPLSILAIFCIVSLEGTNLAVKFLNASDNLTNIFSAVSPCGKNCPITLFIISTNALKGERIFLIPCAIFLKKSVSPRC